MTNSVLWWGRFDPSYSRNGLLRTLLQNLGWTIHDFHPLSSGMGYWQACVQPMPEVDLVWVPCFRQRDIDSAARWARKHGLPLLIDPLISAYDKAVYEKRKFPPDSPQAQRLKAQESKQFSHADVVLADTEGHAQFFRSELGVADERILVVPVGAEEALFRAQQQHEFANKPLQVLFYGSFIPLQGPQVIADAVLQYKGPDVEWTFIGEGPLLDDCKRKLQHQSNVTFLPWVKYDSLPDYIAQADVLLGVFGDTPKAQRVIPNKVYQALACARPVLTGRAAVYPELLLQSEFNTSGMEWVAFDSPEAIAEAVAGLASEPESLLGAGENARATFDTYFSQTKITTQLQQALARLGLE